MAFTIPPTFTTDSRERRERASSTGAGAFFRFTVTCTMPVRSLTRQKVRPPRSRTSWTHPAISARSLSGVMVDIGLAIQRIPPYIPCGGKRCWDSHGHPPEWPCEEKMDISPSSTMTGPARERIINKIYFKAKLLVDYEAHRGFYRR